MEEHYKELYEKSIAEEFRLKGLLLEQLQEIVILRNENLSLREQLDGKPISEKELKLISIAKIILQELDTSVVKGDSNC
jgi:hypothetical protein